MTEPEKHYTKPCDECGTTIVALNWAGLALTRYCQECRDRLNRELEADQARRWRESLAFHRREYLENTTRGVPRKFRDLTWEDFRFDQGGEENRERVRRLRSYAEGFPTDRPPHGYPSVVLASPSNGVGKTMLASLILGTIVHNFEQIARTVCPYQFWSVNRVKMRLRSAERYGSEETVEQVYRELSTVWLLILDDVGKEHADGRDASYAYEMYFNLIDQRYNCELPVIVTSNLGFEPWYEGEPSLVDLMGRAAVSRLAEMAGQIFVIEGEDRR